ncbi:hypothetical protein E2C01_019842 [Portunus trituberculatus]|uniref:Uncharacterized protein n=1 Tax=Portunus trituberculatus TaxID=210409 RepID=A0A5B7DZR2_PORTR|nr:hypothetical protein [Portunus trituberculatus]
MKLSDPCHLDMNHINLIQQQEECKSIYLLATLALTHSRLRKDTKHSEDDPSFQTLLLSCPVTILSIVPPTTIQGTRTKPHREGPPVLHVKPGKPQRNDSQANSGEDVNLRWHI